MTLDITLYYISSLVVGGIAGITLTNTIFKAPKENRKNWWEEYKKMFHPDMSDYERQFLSEYPIPFFLILSRGEITGIEFIEISSVACYILAEFFLFLAFFLGIYQIEFISCGYVFLICAIFFTALTYIRALQKTCKPYPIPTIIRKSQFLEKLRIFLNTVAIP